MSPTEQLEIETKYDVDEHALLPALHELPGVASVAQPVELNLVAVYFDTARFDLAAAGVTLRRRTGGEDDGWHVKVPVASGQRLEIRHELGDEVQKVPIELIRTVRVHVRDQELVPVVTLQTRRLVHRLLDADGKVLAELSEDEVTAEVTGADPESWREWELELVNGGEDLLAAADPLLRDAGAEPAKGPSKLARALGDWVPEAAQWELPNKPTTADMFRNYAGEQVAAIYQRDPEVRRDLPDSVHKMRVATRRLRSALATYRPVVDREAGDQLRAELKWFAGELGGARDAEVLRERLTAMVADEPAELVMGRVAGTIDDHLRGVYKAARQEALEALESERYFRLLDALDALIADPPLVGEPQSAAKQLPELLQHDWKRVRKAVGRVDDADDLVEQQHELHEVRKASKRLRYAGESAEPVLGTDAGKLAALAEQAQEVLGEHQDSVVARDLLRQLAVQVQLDGGNAFTFGRLHALEQQRGADARREFTELWPSIKLPQSLR
jgi:CHAD domain-containing protein